MRKTSWFIVSLFIVVCFLLSVVTAFAQVDITQAEVIPDVASWKLDTVRFLIFTETCEVTYRKVDVNGDSTGQNTKVLFQNIVDNLETPEIDESSDEFNQLVQAINNGSNIKQTITKAVKIKLNMP